MLLRRGLQGASGAKVAAVLIHTRGMAAPTGAVLL
jgi:hypothetical protein